MKINFIVPEISRTGGMRVIFEYANRLTKKGHDVVLYSPIIPFNNYPGELMPYYVKYRFNYTKDFLLRKKKEPENMYERNFEIKYSLWLNNSSIRNADATIATSWTSSYIVNKLNIAKGRKFYLIQDYEQWNSNIEYVNKSYTLPLTRITVSEFLKKFFAGKFGVDSEVVLNGINYHTFNNFDKKFNSPPVILFMEHILENKNTEGAIEIVKKLKDKFPEVRFKCFGKEEYYKLPEFVEFTKDPNDEQIAKLYSTSDIFLYTSTFEGFGLPPAEAMACKCAVVGNNVAAFTEFAENKKSAMIVSPEHPEEMINAGEYLLNNRTELERISIEAGKHIRTVLDWEKSVNKFEKLISG